MTSDPRDASGDDDVYERAASATAEAATARWRDHEDERRRDDAAGRRGS